MARFEMLIDIADLRTLRKAAKMLRTNVSALVRLAAVQEARRVLAESSAPVLSPRQEAEQQSTTQAALGG